MYGFQAVRDAYAQLLEHPDNKYHLTINFKDGYSDNFYHEALNHLIRVLNKKLFGARYMDRGLFLKGFVVRERGESGYLHFHIVITDLRGVLSQAKIPFRSACCRSVHKVYGRHFRLFEKQNEDVRASRLIGKNSWVLQEYYKSIVEDGLEGYLTKTLEDEEVSWSDKNNLVGVLDSQCVQFGVLDSPRKSALSYRYQAEAEFKRYEEIQSTHS